MKKQSIFAKIKNGLNERSLMEQYVRSNEEHDERWFFTSEAKEEYSRCITVAEKTWFIYTYIKVAYAELSEEMQFNIALAIAEKASIPSATVKAYPDIIKGENNPVLNIKDKSKVLKRKVTFANDVLTAIKGKYAIETVKYTDLVSDDLDPEYKFERQIIFGILPLNDIGEYMERSPYAAARNVEAINIPDGLGYRALKSDERVNKAHSELKSCFPKACKWFLKMNELCKKITTPAKYSVKSLMNYVYLHISILVNIVLGIVGLVLPRMIEISDILLAFLFFASIAVSIRLFCTVDSKQQKNYEAWKQMMQTIDDYVVSAERKQFVDDIIKFEEKYVEIVK